MAGGEFHQFDKNTLVSDRSFSFRAWSFSLRELLLGMLVVGLLVTLLFLAGFLGKASSDLQQAKIAASTVERTCRGSSCMKTSAHIMELLNTSVNPCDNFYNFACGGYRVANPADDLNSYKSIYAKMNEDNADQIMAILESPKQRNMDWAAERKVKDFFSACTNSLQREKLKGRPLLDKVLPLLGGWYVKDGNSWNSDNFDLNSALQKIRSDLGVDAFIRFHVSKKYTRNKQSIWIYPGGTSRLMYRSEYASTKLQQAYTKYMRTVAKLVVRDAGISAASDPNLNSRIDTFATDVFQMEAQLATIARNSPYLHDNMVSLNTLNEGTIDWVSFFQYYFTNVGINADTKVVLPYPTYPANFTAMINSLDESTRNRRLNNYLTWRVLESYIEQLSYDYALAHDTFLGDKYGYFSSSFSRMDRQCFQVAQYNFRVALGALYIQTQFEAKNKDKVTEITDTMKTVLEEMIQSNTWMDQKTKDATIEKLKSTTYLLGYPGFMTDQTSVDNYYSQLPINQTDHFGNVLNVKQNDRTKLGQLLLTQKTTVTNVIGTAYNVFQNTIGRYVAWNAVYVMAGAMRFPMYEYNMPHYASFGAIGSIMGHQMIHIVDFYGSKWSKDGVYSWEGWWSEQTKQSYRKSQVCVGNLFGNLTQGPYTADNGDPVTVNVNAKGYANEAIAIISGVQAAYRAYKRWQDKHGQDPVSASLPYSPQQLFFIAHAQTMCHNTDPNDLYKQARRGYVHKDTRLNVALKEMPEFRESFQCKVGDKMVSPKPCTYL